MSGLRACGGRALPLVFSFGFLVTAPAAAADLSRDDGWNRATNILAVSAGAVEVLMPRVFYSDPEVTVGWKARWHLSVLAPAMTLATFTLLNEEFFKGAFKGRLPGCDDTNVGVTGCTSYGMFSTQSFGAFAAVGQGTGVFLADTLKWSNGNFNAGAFIGHVGVPLVLGTITTVGRGAGNLETASEAWGSAGIGVLSGLGMGLLYGLMQRPECGYTGSLLCW
ncbi:MAG TPA: hypothetical protein VF395_00765 [Polyangiaceae bacterium]